ncbi:hypothetical protein Tco_1092406 [Tanacetum coccineum]|uniref:Uncharacterized protein n=1 Tax=Tanacetum coccineum TaxID=301880 RepID=A0ABQ5I9T5_9ASTR
MKISLFHLYPSSSSSLPHHHLYTCSSLRLREVVSCCLNNNKKINISNDKVGFNKIPSRDIVIDFGKHKGKMLGMLPSDYLKWMSTNPLMNTKGDFEKWGKLAQDVLEDEVYADRIEWELAERLLTGDLPSHSSGSSSGSGVAQQLEEIGKKFGWDYNDKSGRWSKLDFRLLGTSKGARLPRIKQPVIELELEQANINKPTASYAAAAVGTDRKKRRERLAKKKEKQIQLIRNNQQQEEEKKINNEIAKDEENPTRFPGRQSLINKLN